LPFNHGSIRQLEPENTTARVAVVAQAWLAPGLGLTETLDSCAIREIALALSRDFPLANAM